MAQEEGESAVGVRGAAEKQAHEDRSAFLRWLLFYLVCGAGIAGLPWLGATVPLSPLLRGVGFVLGVLLLPLASVLTPFFWLRRAPRKERKGAWQLLPMVFAAAGLGVLSLFAGQDAALQERGRVTEAKVVAVEQGKTDRCTLQQPNGQEIPLDLKEGDGCDTGIKRGDTVRVRYDPEGAVNPVNDSWKPTSYGAPIAALAAVFVALGTWGSGRMARRDREYIAA
ncbi:hypothetical protein AB0I82_09285 [Streptomyces sp. NPDC050315]|uniref:hypothetical protein n=1 Tax=Streptomyces sp. NPDC050315 TaxID=3155039 RepID=UPI0034192F93